MENYFYLIWALIFLLVWSYLFLRRTDTRREMLFVSIIFGFGGLACEKTNIQDWWQPITITGTSIGVEDFIIGFAIGGVASVIYENIYRIKIRKNSKLKNPIDPGFYLLIFPVIYLSAFFLFELGSVYSMLITYIVCILYMLITRKDLLADSLLSGLWMLFIGTSIYFILFLIYPSYIEDFWYLRDGWYSTIVLGLPVGEYIFFFLTGAYIGPLYEYVNKSKLIKYNI